MSFVLQHGSYVVEAPCPGCGAEDGWRCYPGRWPECWRCGVKVLKYGRTPEADCVTPNGRIDSHMRWVKRVGKGRVGVGKTVCAFCEKAE